MAFGHNEWVQCGRSLLLFLSQSKRSLKLLSRVSQPWWGKEGGELNSKTQHFPTVGKPSSRISMEMIQYAQTVILYKSEKSGDLFWRAVCTDGFILWVTHRRLPLLFFLPNSFANVVCQRGELREGTVPAKGVTSLVMVQEDKGLVGRFCCPEEQSFSLANELGLWIYHFLHKKCPPLLYRRWSKTEKPA